MRKAMVSAWIGLALLLVLGISAPALAIVEVPDEGTPDLAGRFGIGIYGDFVIGQVTGSYPGLHLEYNLGDRLFLQAFGTAGEDGQGLAIGVGYAFLQFNKFSEWYVGLDLYYLSDSFGDRSGPVLVIGSRGQGIAIPFTNKMLVIGGLWFDFSIGLSSTEFVLDDSISGDETTLRMGAEWVF